MCVMFLNYISNEKIKTTRDQGTTVVKESNMKTSHGPVPRNLIN